MKKLLLFHFTLFTVLPVSGIQPGTYPNSNPYDYVYSTDSYGRVWESYYVNLEWSLHNHVLIVQKRMNDAYNFSTACSSEGLEGGGDRNYMQQYRFHMNSDGSFHPEEEKGEYYDVDDNLISSFNEWTEPSYKFFVGCRPVWDRDNHIIHAPVAVHYTLAPWHKHLPSDITYQFDNSLPTRLSGSGEKKIV